MILAMIEVKGIDQKMIANNTEPFEPTHPGELLRDEIECRLSETACCRYGSIIYSSE